MKAEELVSCSKRTFGRVQGEAEGQPAPAGADKKKTLEDLLAEAYDRGYEAGLKAAKEKAIKPPGSHPTLSPLDEAERLPMATPGPFFGHPGEEPPEDDDEEYEAPPGSIVDVMESERSESEQVGFGFKDVFEKRKKTSTW